MILDTHQNLHSYASIFCDVDCATVFRWLEKCESYQPDTKVDFHGDKLFARILRPTTVPSAESRWENHREYVDLQYVVGGGEIIEWSPASDLVSVGAYDADRDVQFYQETSPTQRLVMNNGLLVFFFPDDAHKPQVADGIHSHVHKAVVKIHRSLLLL